MPIITTEELLGKQSNKRTISTEELFKVNSKQPTPLETIKDIYSKTTGAIPTISQIGGNIIGGMAGSAVGHPYTGAATGGVVGRGIGEAAKIRYQKEPKALIKDVLSATMPVVGQAIPTKAFTSEESKKIVKETAKQIPWEAGGAVTGYGIAKTLQPIWRITGGKIPFIKRLRNSFIDVKRNAGKEFEAGLKTLEETNPNGRVNIYDDILNLKQSMLGSAEKDIPANPDILKNIRAGQKKAGSDLLEQLIANPLRAENLTLQEARTIKQIIQKSPDIANNLAKGKLANWQPAHQDLLDFIDNTKAKIAISFPDIKGVNAKYANVINKYNTIKNSLKEGKLIGAIEKGGHGLREEEIWRNYVVPLLKSDKSSRRVLRELTSYIRTPKIMKGLGAMAIGSGVLGGISQARKLINK